MNILKTYTQFPYDTGWTVSHTYGWILEGETEGGLWSMGATFGVIAEGKKEAGVFGRTEAAERGGVHGQNDNRSGVAYGVTGITTSPDGAAVAGQNTGSGAGLQGFTETGDAVQGFTSGEGKSGVWGHNARETGLCSGVAGSSMSRQGAGVLGRGQGSESAGVMGVNGEGAGVIGHSISGAGAMGVSDNFHGVVGTASNNARCGVFGINASGYGVGGKSIDGIGVIGGSSHNQGVFGITTGADYTAGVVGMCTGVDNTAGVWGIATGGGAGVYGQGETAAGAFDGNVFVTGNLVVQGAGQKNGVVTLKDGSHRLVCAIESPEAWFEDFGEAKLVTGTAHISLDPDFAQAVDTASYHVFITAYGDCGGLYVSNRTGKGFDVTEHGGGRSEVAFSWRVVATPKDAKKGRFAPAPAFSHFAGFKGKRRKAPDLSAFEKMDTGLPSLKLPKLPRLSLPKRPAFGKMKPPKKPKAGKAKPMAQGLKELLEMTAARSATKSRTKT